MTLLEHTRYVKMADCLKYHPLAEFCRCNLTVHVEDGNYVIDFTEHPKHSNVIYRVAY